MASVINTITCFYKIVKNRNILCNYIDSKNNAPDIMKKHITGKTPILNGHVSANEKLFKINPLNNEEVKRQGRNNKCPNGFKKNEACELGSFFNKLFPSDCKRCLPIWNSKINMKFVPQTKDLTSGYAIIHIVLYIDKDIKDYCITEVLLGAYTYNLTTHEIYINAKSKSGKNVDITHSYIDKTFITQMKTQKNTSSTTSSNNTTTKNENRLGKFIDDLKNDADDVANDIKKEAKKVYKDIKSDVNDAINWAKLNINTVSWLSLIDDAVEKGSLLDDVISFSIVELGTDIGGTLGNILINGSNDITIAILADTGIGILGELGEVVLDSAGFSIELDEAGLSMVNIDSITDADIDSFIPSSEIL